MTSREVYTLSSFNSHPVCSCWMRDATEKPIWRFRYRRQNLHQMVHAFSMIGCSLIPRPLAHKPTVCTIMWCTHISLLVSFPVLPNFWLFATVREHWGKAWFILSCEWHLGRQRIPSYLGYTHCAWVTFLWMLIGDNVHSNFTLSWSCQTFVCVFWGWT